MFDFERLDVYQLVREQNLKVLRYIYKQKEIDDQIKDHWKKASMNIVSYLAEATGKMNNPDKRHFLTNSRTSVFEAVALLEAHPENIDWYEFSKNPADGALSLLKYNPDKIC